MIGLLKSELRKVRTTNVWWIMLLALIGFTGLAVAGNILQGASVLDNPPPADANGDLSPNLQAKVALASNARFIASNVYTSGQFFGLLIATVMGALIITNEFHHQTATATFLTTPNRLRVVGAKLGAAVVWGAVYGALTTLLSVPSGAVWLHSRGLSTYLGDADVLKAIGLNLLAFGIWAVFGLGLGTLIKNQIGTIVVILVLYLIANQLVSGILLIVSQRFHLEWLYQARYALPSIESQVMTSAVQEPGGPSWWAAALMLLGYGMLAAGLGGLLTRRRDIA